MSLIKISKEEYCNIGLNIIKKNKFYLTLHFLLKCHFIKQDDFNIINYIVEYFGWGIVTVVIAVLDAIRSITG